MAESLILILIVLALGTVGILLRERSRGHSERWRSLLRSLYPEASFDTETERAQLRLRGRALALHSDETRLIIDAFVAEPPLAWRLAARALGDGPLIAALFATDIAIERETVRLSLKKISISARRLREAIERIADIAERLEAIPMAEAMARHVLDFAPPAERAEAFETLTRHFGDAPVTRQCALLCKDTAEAPALAAKAEAWLRGEEG